MPNFNYVAMDSRGKETKGTLPANNQGEAINRLKEMGYFPTKVTEAEKPKEKGADKKAPPIKKPAGAKGKGSRKPLNIPGFGSGIPPRFSRRLRVSWQLWWMQAFRYSEGLRFSKNRRKILLFEIFLIVWLCQSRVVALFLKDSLNIPKLSIACLSTW